MDELNNINCVNKRKTPAEIQREITSGYVVPEEKLQNIPDNNDPGAAALVAAIEAGLPYFGWFDDGKNINIKSKGLSEPAILGLLYAFTKKIERKLNNHG